MGPGLEEARNESLENMADGATIGAIGFRNRGCTREALARDQIMDEKAKPQSEAVKMTVTLPRSVAAFLRWKAEVEGMKRDELLRKIIVHYAKKLREEDFRTPPIED